MVFWTWKSGGTCNFCCSLRKTIFHGILDEPEFRSVFMSVFRSEFRLVQNPQEIPNYLNRASKVASIHIVSSYMLLVPQKNQRTWITTRLVFKFSHSFLWWNYNFHHNSLTVSNENLTNNLTFWVLSDYLHFISSKWKILITEKFYSIIHEWRHTWIQVSEKLLVIPYSCRTQKVSLTLTVSRFKVKALRK